ncbi:MAG: TonB-dependent receptor [Chitinophagales bacterium]|nr:MAG: TonB-dependent receptor [Chitinophagales bacterium]
MRLRMLMLIFFQPFMKDKSAATCVRFLAVTVCLLLIFPVYGQYRLSGKVLDEQGHPLHNATVFVSSLERGTYSDSSGWFQLILPEGAWEILISYLGFETANPTIFLSSDTLIEFKLKAALMPEVAISEKRTPRMALMDEGGAVVLPKESFFLLPSFLGENDPMRTVQMQPGVQSGSEGSRGIFIRGGSPDQNLMLLDGVPVFNPSHIYGFISVFNGDAIERIDLYKDKYPARFGGRLGSVITIQSADGTTERISGQFSLGLITSRLHLEGPLTCKKHTVFSFSARVCYAGLYLKPISRRQFAGADQQGTVSYYFGDVNARMIHRFNDRHRVELSFFANRDYYSLERTYRLSNLTYYEQGDYLNQVKWGNEVASMAWIARPTSQWEVTTRAGYSHYRLDGSYADVYGSFIVATGDTNYMKGYYTDAVSYVRHLSLYTDVAYSSGRHSVRAGLGGQAVLFEPGEGTEQVKDFNAPDQVFTDTNRLYPTAEWFLYAEDTYKAHEKLTLASGVHARLYNPGNKAFVSLEPRLHILYNPLQRLFVRASASALSQNLHLLTAVNVDVLNDYWVPATAKAPPEIGWNFTAGVMQKLPRYFEWSMDGFYRVMHNLVEYKDESSPGITETWENRIVSGGTGIAYGVEFYLARTAGKVSGSLAYTLAWSKRKFDALNQGKFFPYKYDRRHNVAAQINYRFRKHFEISTSWVYGSGNAYTLAIQLYDSWYDVATHEFNVRNGIPTASYAKVKVYAGRNNARLPAYHHLDLSFTYRKSIRRFGHTFNISVYNVYNRLNVFSIYRDSRTDKDGNIRVSYRQLSLFPVLPSLTYTISF